MFSPPVNIWSGHNGPEAALTNPTALAKRKGHLFRDYPVHFRGKTYVDAESAYHSHADGKSFEEAQEIVFLIVHAKLTQYPELVDLITARGGVAWLESCTHSTGAGTDGFKRWEGRGRESAFMRALIRAYEVVLKGEKIEEPGQMNLF